MRILYLGGDPSPPPHCTSWHRAMALKRIGHEVDYVIPHNAIRWNRWNRVIHFRTGYRFIKKMVEAYVLAEAQRIGPRFDVVWVDGGELVPAGLLASLRRLHSPVIVNYNCDDPTGRRDGGRWHTFLQSLGHYDLTVVVRPESAAEYPGFGAKKVLHIFRSADEVAHAPRVITPELQREWGSDVAFVGTWLPERGPFLMDLLGRGVPVSIWGNRWQKSPEWARLKAYWRGPHLVGDDYALAIQCAKISLGLLSTGNRDKHTTRSLEIPALGSLLCAERTAEHQSLYAEGREAVFWADAAECAEKIRHLLANPGKCAAIAEAGHRRWQADGFKNEVVMRSILAELNRTGGNL